MDGEKRNHYVHGVSIVPTYESDFGPSPDPELGRNLATIEDVRTWLQHPSNWFDSDMFVIRWSGVVPSINKRHAHRLRVETHDNGLYGVVLLDQYNLKHPKEVKIEEVFKEEEG